MSGDSEVDTRAWRSTRDGNFTRSRAEHGQDYVSEMSRQRNGMHLFWTGSGVAPTVVARFAKACGLMSFV